MNITVKGKEGLGITTDNGVKYNDAKEFSPKEKLGLKLIFSYK